VADPYIVSDEPRGHKPLAPSVISHRWRVVRKASEGLAGVRFHDIRHTNISELIAAGVDVRTVAGRETATQAFMDTRDVNTRMTTSEPARGERLHRPSTSLESSEPSPGDDRPIEMSSRHAAVARCVPEVEDGTERGGDPVAPSVGSHKDGGSNVEGVEVG